MVFAKKRKLSRDVQSSVPASPSTPQPRRKYSRRSDVAIQSATPSAGSPDIKQTDNNNEEVQGRRLLNGLIVDQNPVDYDSIEESLPYRDSGIVGLSLQRSRRTWLTGCMFEQFWVKPQRGRKLAGDGQNAKDKMIKLGECRIQIGPHYFDWRLFAVKDESYVSNEPLGGEPRVASTDGPSSTPQSTSSAVPGNVSVTPSHTSDALPRDVDNAKSTDPQPATDSNNGSVPSSGAESTQPLSVSAERPRDLSVSPEPSSKLSVLPEKTLDSTGPEPELNTKPQTESPKSDTPPKAVSNEKTSAPALLSEVTTKSSEERPAEMAPKTNLVSEATSSSSDSQPASSSSAFANQTTAQPPPPPPPPPPPRPTPSRSNEELVKRLHALAQADANFDFLLKAVASGKQTVDQMREFHAYLNDYRGVLERASQAKQSSSITPKPKAPSTPAHLKHKTEPIRKERELIRDQNLVFEFRENPTERFLFPKRCIVSTKNRVTTVTFFILAGLPRTQEPDSNEKSKNEKKERKGKRDKGGDGVSEDMLAIKSEADRRIGEDRSSQGVSGNVKGKADADTVKLEEAELSESSKGVPLPTPTAYTPITMKLFDLSKKQLEMLSRSTVEETEGRKYMQSIAAKVPRTRDWYVYFTLSQPERDTLDMDVPPIGNGNPVLKKKAYTTAKDLESSTSVLHIKHFT